MNFVYTTVDPINKVILMRSAKHLASLVMEPEHDERWVAAQQWCLTNRRKLVIPQVLRGLKPSVDYGSNSVCVGHVVRYKGISGMNMVCASVGVFVCERCVHMCCVLSVPMGGVHTAHICVSTSAYHDPSSATFFARAVPGKSAFNPRVLNMERPFSPDVQRKGRPFSCSGWSWKLLAVKRQVCTAGAWCGGILRREVHHRPCSSSL